MNEISTFWGVGRRKSSIARVRVISPGKGGFYINKKSVDKYFSGHERQKNVFLQALKINQNLKNCDISVNVSGGGMTGQAGAIRLGLSRALAQVDPNLRIVLHKEGFLTRDPRMVERKKPGQAKARKRFQWTKR